MEQIDFGLPEITPTNITDMAINLAFCVVASFVLRSLYVNKSISLSGKFHIGTVIPILSIVTFLVIMVVKSSLALSLGLVGALSIVRFRTPIKEPEELVYLFIAIALGLGFGAGQTFLTSFVFSILVVLIYVWLSRQSVNYDTEFNVLIDWTETNLDITDIIGRVKPLVARIELQKHTVGEFEKSLFLKVEARNFEEIDALVKSVVAGNTKVSCTVVQARPLQ